MRGEQLPLTDASGNPLVYDDKSRAQRVRQQTDTALTALTQVKVPGASFWWRVSVVDGVTAVFCRLCENRIELGDIEVGFTGQQLDLIEGHKLLHWRDLLPKGARR